MRIDLTAAYRATRYVVADGKISVTLRIGVKSEEFDRFLHRHQAQQGVFITAWNPWSIRHDRVRNTRASLELGNVLARFGQRFLRAINLAGDPDWSEESFLVFDLSIEDALLLASAYGQNAVVLAEPAKIPRLLWTARSVSRKTASGLE